MRKIVELNESDLGAVAGGEEMRGLPDLSEWDQVAVFEARRDDS
jgi:hypothetical protein